MESLNPKPVQGIYRDRTLMTFQLRMAARAIGSSIDKPGVREEIAMGKAQKAIDKFVADVTQFFDEDWNNYKKLITEKEINYFTNFE